MSGHRAMRRDSTAGGWPSVCWSRCGWTAGAGRGGRTGGDADAAITAAWQAAGGDTGPLSPHKPGCTDLLVMSG